MKVKIFNYGDLCRVTATLVNPEIILFWNNSTLLATLDVYKKLLYLNDVMTSSARNIICIIRYMSFNLPTTLYCIFVMLLLLLCYHWLLLLCSAQIAFSLSLFPWTNVTFNQVNTSCGL